jgi:hypothetical protein
MYLPSSHETFTHDSLSSLGYDWSRVADPHAPPKPPLKVYLPRTTDEVVRVVREARECGDTLVVRGYGHSSNNLVTPERGVLVLTQLMNRIVEVNELAMTVTVQCGTALLALDEHLAELGLGLSVIGDHEHITAAGFASVGGISPSSLRYGMFVDTVVALEYVDSDGTIKHCDRSHGRDELMRLLCGLGRYGVITELTIAIVRVDKYHTLYANHRHITPSLSDFLAYSGREIRDPGDAELARGIWADLAVPGRSDASLTLGQFCSYHKTTQNPVKRLLNRAEYGYQGLLGYFGGRLPKALDDVVKYLGMGCIIFSPLYATQKEIERFSDQVLDATSGDPTRWLVVLAPAERYETLFHQLYEICRSERQATGAITFIAIYVKSVRSEYLSGGDPDRRHCEVLLHLGIRPERMTTAVLQRLVTRIDDATLANGGLRYLHSLTGSDPAKREQLDPNSRYHHAPRGNGHLRRVKLDSRSGGAS